MASDESLAGLLADAGRRVPVGPGLAGVIEDAGRQRLAAYYLYCALISGVMRGGDLSPARWPERLAQPMHRLGLTRFAPRTGRGLDAQLTPAEQARRRSPGRQQEFARQLADLISHGAFGPLCGDADRVRLAGDGERRGLELELIKDGQVSRTCAVEDHWELVAQYLAGAAPGGPLADAPGLRRPGPRVTWLKNTAIAHAVSFGTRLAVNVHPLGAAADLGTRLILSRLQAGRTQADALGRLGRELGDLHADADGELADLEAGR